MPKGSIKAPGSAKTMEKRQYTAAYNASNYRDNSGLTKRDRDAAYASVRSRDMAKANAKEVRADPGSRIKKTKAPVGKGGR